jgi:hypothetical protein
MKPGLTGSGARVSQSTGRHWIMATPARVLLGCAWCAWCACEAPRVERVHVGTHAPDAHSALPTENGVGELLKRPVADVKVLERLGPAAPGLRARLPALGNARSILTQHLRAAARAHTARHQPSPSEACMVCDGRQAGQMHGAPPLRSSTWHARGTAGACAARHTRPKPCGAAHTRTHLTCVQGQLSVMRTRMARPRVSSRHSVVCVLDARSGLPGKGRPPVSLTLGSISSSTGRKRSPSYEPLEMRIGLPELSAMVARGGSGTACTCGTRTARSANRAHLAACLALRARRPRRVCTHTAAARHSPSTLVSSKQRIS